MWQNIILHKIELHQKYICRKKISLLLHVHLQIIRKVENLRTVNICFYVKVLVKKVRFPNFEKNLCKYIVTWITLPWRCVLLPQCTLNTQRVIFLWLYWLWRWCWYWWTCLSSTLVHRMARLILKGSNAGSLLDIVNSSSGWLFNVRPVTQRGWEYFYFIEQTKNYQERI